LSSVPSRKIEWDLTPEAFEQLLFWLNPNREQAGRKYEEIRRKLIKIFTCRGCICPEELADETMNRVTRKVPEIIGNYVGDPSLYFYGVAHNVHLEYVRKKPNLLPPPAPDPPEETERDYECLDQCMERLTSKSRELVLEYYQSEKRAKIDRRKELASRLGIAVNALRIRAHRIRSNLQECVFECTKRKQEDEMDGGFGS
jgi:DNA-directed RNA polymerase specialized sigma24 family protein